MLCVVVTGDNTPPRFLLNPSLDVTPRGGTHTQRYVNGNLTTNISNFVTFVAVSPCAFLQYLSRNSGSNDPTAWRTHRGGFSPYRHYTTEMKTTGIHRSSCGEPSQCCCFTIGPVYHTEVPLGRQYTHSGVPTHHGAAESIVCSKQKHHDSCDYAVW